MRAWLCLLLIACGADHGAAFDAQPTADAFVVTGTGCEAYETSPYPLSTDWITTQAATGYCALVHTIAQAGPPSQPRQMYGACTNTPVFNPGGCDLRAGMEYCDNGLVTLCAANADCPGGTLCFWGSGTGDVPPQVNPRFGVCEKTCSPGSGTTECARCDLSCIDLGVCVNNGTNGELGGDVPCPALVVTLEQRCGFGAATCVGHTGELDVTFPGMVNQRYDVPVSSFDADGHATLRIPYPANVQAGDVSLSFYAIGPGLFQVAGTATAPIDLTACTSIDLLVCQEGPGLDAGAPGCPL